MPTAGAMIREGRYTCKLAPGEYKVSFNGGKPDERKFKDTDGPSGATMTELLPAKYNQSTTLMYDAQAGIHEKNWDLAK